MLRYVSGNMAKARQIGSEMRTARNAAGLTATAVAELLDVRPSTITRWEKGERKQKPVDLERYLRAVNAPQEQIIELVELAEDTDASPWLAVSLPSQRRQHDALVKVEATAQSIVAMSPLIIPGLAQTADYVRAVMKAAKVPERELESRVATRVGRKQAILRRNPAHFTALIGEMVLTQNIGGPEVMSDQLRSLLEDAERPNVDIHIIPNKSGWHPGLTGPFTLLVAENGQPVVHDENRRSALFYHDYEDVAAYQEAVNDVLEIAMSPADSAMLIRSVISRLEPTE